MNSHGVIFQGGFVDINVSRDTIRECIALITDPALFSETHANVQVSEDISSAQKGALMDAIGRSTLVNLWIDFFDPELGKELIRATTTPGCKLTSLSYCQGGEGGVADAIIASLKTSSICEFWIPQPDFTGFSRRAKAEIEHRKSLAPENIAERRKLWKEWGVCVKKRGQLSLSNGGAACKAERRVQLGKA